MNDSHNKTVVFCQAGLLQWGEVSQKFAQIPKAVSILIDYDSATVTRTWEAELSYLESRWKELREVLDKVLPGGIGAATLDTIDLRSHIRPSPAQQKAFQPITGPALVMDRGGASANQVADGFILLIGHMDGCEFAGAIESGQLIGIPAVGLHPIGSSFGNERRTNQVAVNIFAAQVAAENEAAWSGFIYQAQFNVWPRETFEEFVNRVEGSANDAVAAHFARVLRRDGNGN